MNILTNDYGIETDNLSVDKKHYDDFLSTMYDKRLIGPKVDLLIEELLELRLVQKATKVIIDHPRKGSKDLSDATCGAIFNAVENTYRPQNEIVEVMTLKDLHKREKDAMVEEVVSKHYANSGIPKDFDGVIRPPADRAKVKSDIPADLSDFLEAFRTL
jgi:hypothetical protein